MNNVNFVTKALEYYDNNRESYRNLFKDVVYMELINREDATKHNQIKMYDKDNKLMYRVSYEIIGIYTNATKTWTWSWSIPHLKKISTTTSRKILNYAFDLDARQYNFLKTELTTSRFRVNTPVQLDVHVALGSYLSKNPIIMPLVWYLEAERVEMYEDGKPVLKEWSDISMSGKMVDTSHNVKKIKKVSPGEFGEAYQIYYLIMDFSSVNIDEYVKNPKIDLKKL